MKRPFCFHFSTNQRLDQYNLVPAEYGCNKVVIELRVVQFWSEMLLVILNRTRTSHSSDFKIMHMISDQIALYSVQLPLSIIPIDK